MIITVNEWIYENRVKECGITGVKTRCLKADQIEVFKITKGHQNINKIFFQSEKDTITRAHVSKLTEEQRRLDIPNFYFSHRTINV